MNTYDRVMQLIEQQRGVRPQSNSVSLGGLGFDSLDCVEFGIALEDEFDIDVDVITKKTKVVDVVNMAEGR